MSALVSFDRVFEVLDLPPMIDDAPDAVELPQHARTIEFPDVRFSYPTAAEVSLASLEASPRLTRLRRRRCCAASRSVPSRGR